MTRVLLVGLLPETVDYSDPALPPDTNAKKIQARVELGLKQMTDRGWQAAACLIRPDVTAGPAVAQKLATTTYDCIVIGGVVRLPPSSNARSLDSGHEPAVIAKLAWHRGASR